MTTTTTSASPRVVRIRAVGGGGLVLAVGVAIQLLALGGDLVAYFAGAVLLLPIVAVLRRPTPGAAQRED